MYSKAGIVLDHREMLRVKAKSLAEEARIIRQEERRTRGELRESLHWHRVWPVRSEARATYMAYGLIKGLVVDRIEKPGSKRSPVLWDKVRGMIKKYGPTDPQRTATLLEQCKN